MSDTMDDDNTTGTGTEIRPRRSPPVPATVEGLLSRYTLRRKPNLNDAFQVHFVKLWGESEKFRNYLEACYIQETVEGDFHCDDHEAARMVREAALRAGDQIVAFDSNGKQRTIAVLIKALHVMLNRYDLNRRKRASGETD